MKVFVYYATEENGFEIDKFEVTNPMEFVRRLMQDDYLQTDEIESAIEDMEHDFNEYGFATYETEQGQGYTIIIGIAKQGKCNDVRREIHSVRSELFSEIW